jgi:hypothetical protein
VSPRTATAPPRPAQPRTQLLEFFDAALRQSVELTRATALEVVDTVLQGFA